MCTTKVPWGSFFGIPAGGPEASDFAMQLLKKSVHFGLRSESPDLSFPGGGLGGVLAFGKREMHIFARFFV